MDLVTYLIGRLWHIVVDLPSPLPDRYTIHHTGLSHGRRRSRSPVCWRWLPLKVPCQPHKAREIHTVLGSRTSCMLLTCHQRLLRTVETYNGKYMWCLSGWHSIGAHSRKGLGRRSCSGLWRSRSAPRRKACAWWEDQRVSEQSEGSKGPNVNVPPMQLRRP